jgi:hypothetical protein
VRPALVAAAALVLLGVGAWLGRVSVPAPDRPEVGSPSPVATASLQPVRFVLVAPRASRVALVGDFNGWDAAVTPMRRDAASDAWTVDVPLSSGWHAYAFVVDEKQWVPDPKAPLAPSDGLGGPRSVVVVGERGT